MQIMLINNHSPENMSVLNYIQEKVHEKDKQQHFVISFLITIISLFLMSVLNTMVFVITIGVLKEIWDSYKGTGFCWIDMLSNMIGMLSGIIVMLVIY